MIRATRVRYLRNAELDYFCAHAHAVAIVIEDYKFITFPYYNPKKIFSELEQILEVIYIKKITEYVEIISD